VGLEKFEIKVENKACLDIGSSTGGFTQILCEGNAKQVFSIDVGSDQFDKSLLKKYENKINLFEKTDIRNFGKEKLEEGHDNLEYKNISSSIYSSNFDIIVCDISFISITKIVENIFELLKEGGEGVILIKPQFEVGRENIGKGGLVKSANESISYDDLITKTINSIKIIFEENNLKVISIIDSPILGGDGNKEFLMHIQK
jgi:23S rRNA (cytidine1920-2'-O)/16S rRNA (cytidine1409-2'-O)-methyltransferase